MWGQYVQSFCVCLCVFASVGVCHWWSWRLLLLLWEIHPHTPISPSSLSLSPSPPPSCCIKEMGGKGTFVTLLSLTHRDNHTAHRTHIPLGHAGHLEKKRLSVSAGSPQLEGLRTEKRRGENTITRSIIIYADRLRRFAGTAHTFGESVSHLSSRGGRRLPAMRIFNLIYLLLLLVALLASSYSARPGMHCDPFSIHSHYVFSRRKNFDE